ncbi:MAG TPA: hypothetical protein VFH63_04855 [candidate division Zixibacteria bacterium]|nr:hypothetical protein [candidate division Zixibacteria bacterium]
MTHRRRSPVRVLGWMLTAVVYAALLVFAADLTSAATAAGADPSALALTSGAAVAGDVAPVAATATGAAESPLVTLALAAGAATLFGMFRALRLVRRPRPAPVRPAARRIHTLT